MKCYDEKTIKLINVPEDLDTIDSRTPFLFVCKKCKTKQFISGWKTCSRKEKYKNMLCTNCSFKLNFPLEQANANRIKTFNTRYGCNSVGGVKEFQSKIKKTKQEKYNDPYYNNHKKAVQTYFNKTGYETPLHNRKLVEQGMLNKYNVKYPVQDKMVLKKIQDTYSKRTSYTNPMKNPEVKEQFKLNTFKKYGTEYYFSSDNYKHKMNELYGNPVYVYTDNYKNKMIDMFGVPYPKRKRYMYDNVYFDSAWELALWIYAKDHNEEIIREPCLFEYTFDGKKCDYYPDFYYKGKYIEIKGNHFFKDGKMIFPYNRFHSDGPLLTEKEKKYMDDLYEAKHKCGLKNNVEFWGKEEIKPYIDYIEDKYGIDYLPSFKVIKKESDIAFFCS